MDPWGGLSRASVKWNAILSGGGSARRHRSVDQESAGISQQDIVMGQGDWVTSRKEEALQCRWTMINDIHGLRQVPLQGKLLYLSKKCSDVVNEKQAFVSNFQHMYKKNNSIKYTDKRRPTKRGRYHLPVRFPYSYCKATLELLLQE